MYKKLPALGKNLNNIWILFEWPSCDNYVRVCVQIGRSLVCRLQVHVLRQAGYGVVGAQLLLSVREHRGSAVLPDAGRPRGEDLQRGARVWAQHSAAQPHAVLPVMLYRSVKCHLVSSNTHTQSDLYYWSASSNLNKRMHIQYLYCTCVLCLRYIRSAAPLFPIAHVSGILLAFIYYSNSIASLLYFWSTIIYSEHI